MSELKIKDGDGTDKFIGSIGTGATGDPYHNIPSDFLIEVAKDNVTKHMPLSKFGTNDDIDIGSFEHIWDGGGSYVPPTQARIHDVTSTSASDAGTVVSNGTATGGTSTTLTDTGATFISDGVSVGDLVLNDTDTTRGSVSTVTSETVLTFVSSLREPELGRIADDFESGDSYRIVADASTGASMIYVIGLDASLLEITEFVVLNGTSNVATSKSYKRQSRARSFADASTGTAGTITSTAQIDGTVTCQIVNGNNQSLMAIYTIPRNKTGYIVSWWGTLSKKQAAASVVVLKAGQLDMMGYVLQTRGINATGSSDFYYDYKMPRPIVGGSDIWVEADTDTNDAAISSGFELLLVEE